MEEVDGEGDFGEDKVGASPEHDVGKVEKVEEDEMRPNTACCLHPNVVARKQMQHISYLAKEHGNPINRYKDMVDGEWSRMSMALSKGSMSVMVVMMW